jgi:hypothetical protein
VAGHASLGLGDPSVDAHRWVTVGRIIARVVAERSQDVDPSVGF